MSISTFASWMYAGTTVVVAPYWVLTMREENPIYCIFWCFQYSSFNYWMFWELSNLLLYFIKDFIKEECWGLLIGNVIAICFSGFLNHEVWDSWRSEKSKDSRINCRWVGSTKESNNFWNLIRNFPIFPISRIISKTLEFVMLIKNVKKISREISEK